MCLYSLVRFGMASEYILEINPQQPRMLQQNQPTEDCKSPFLIWDPMLSNCDWKFL